MVHVIPINDEREHEKSTACWCSPDVQWDHPETGQPLETGIVTHSSADCREYVEELTGDSVSPEKLWEVVRI